MTDDAAPPQGAITQWLLDWGRSDKRGLDDMLPVLYQELHRLASSYLSREAPGHTLQPTALVHEAYLRLVDQRRLSLDTRIAIPPTRFSRRRPVAGGPRNGPSAERPG